MKKGFTLIELLAVIVILAIIALIAAPIILDIINNSKEKSIVRSAENYINALEYSLAKTINNEDEIKDGEYKIIDAGNICIAYEEDECKKELKVEVDGEIPLRGRVTIENKKIKDYELVYKNYIINKGLNPIKNIYVDVKDSNPGVICGKGEKEDLTLEKCHIKSIEDLVALSTLVNKGNSFEGKIVELSSSLDFNNEASYESKTIDKSLITEGGFYPIGKDKSFKGTFDGNNNTIKGLYINDSTIYTGLFGVTSQATIKNLKIEDANVTGSQDVSSLVGYNTGGTIENIKLKNIDLIGTTYVGALLGRNNEGTIRNIRLNNINVDGPQSSGGVIGANLGKLVQNVIGENIKVNSSYRYAGGFSGSNAGVINNIKLIDIEVNGSVYVGGISGSNTGSLNNIKIKGDVYAPGQYSGLAVGFNYGNVGSVAVSGNVGNNSYTGGLIGSTRGTVETPINISAVMLNGSVTGHSYSRLLIAATSNSNLNLLVSKDVLFNDKVLISNDQTGRNGKSLEDMGKNSQSEYEAIGFNFDKSSDSYWYFNENDELDLFIK